MIDTDKYEPTRTITLIDNLLHNTKAHSLGDWWMLSKSLIELSDDDRLLIAYAPTLRAEVKRLREQVKDLEYEVEHWQGELQSRMHPIDYDALVNGGEEE